MRDQDNDETKQGEGCGRRRSKQIYCFGRRRQIVEKQMTPTNANKFPSVRAKASSAPLLLSSVHLPKQDSNAKQSVVIASSFLL